ncbi:spore coat U domain-containing protein [Cypionkella sp.]|uniref:Csu type fimbrial protein n=1 Tax=Cypionkella sp. TaxID=2811411 RepID=UPI002629E251|nr:spore coat U domain-containing protein [Cypionkella sp.]
MRRILWTLALTIAACFCVASTAQAQSCTFSATNLAFGAVDTLGAGATDTTGTITVRCSAFVGLLSSMTMTISIGEGRGGATASSRRMAGLTTATPLTYQLYSNAARTQIIGSSYWSFGGSPITLSGATLLSLQSGSAVQVQVYGRVTGGQTNVVPGSYQSVFDRNPTDVRVDYRTCSLLLLCTNRTGTFTFTVQASVSANCLVSATDLNFGSVGLLDKNHDASSQINVTCTPLSAYSVGLNAGLHSRANGARRMQDGAGHQIEYGLFQNAGRTLSWGALSSGTAQTSAGSGGAQQYSVYGRVPLQPTPPAGIYSDSVAVTITY